jgi:hypothetical protein
MTRGKRTRTVNDARPGSPGEGARLFGTPSQSSSIGAGPALREAVAQGLLPSAIVDDVEENVDGQRRGSVFMSQRMSGTGRKVMSSVYAPTRLVPEPST